MSRMSFKDAMDLVPDDLPDGAFWALAHDIAGLEYGDGFEELISDDGMFGAEAVEPSETNPRIGYGASRNPDQAHKKHVCLVCNKRFRKLQGVEHHLRDVHGEAA